MPCDKFKLLIALETWYDFKLSEIVSKPVNASKVLYLEDNVQVRCLSRHTLSVSCNISAYDDLQSSQVIFYWDLVNNVIAPLSTENIG